MHLVNTPLLTVQMHYHLRYHLPYDLRYDMRLCRIATDSEPPGRPGPAAASQLSLRILQECTTVQYQFSINK